MTLTFDFMDKYFDLAFNEYTNNRKLKRWHYFRNMIIYIHLYTDGQKEGFKLVYYMIL